MINTDYTYCTGHDCRIRDTCKRYNQEALDYPSNLTWFNGDYRARTNKCGYYAERDEKCCGNCDFFLHEDIDGYGICVLTDREQYCGDCCEEHKEDINGHIVRQ